MHIKACKTVGPPTLGPLEIIINPDIRLMYIYRYYLK